jgi:superfamily I DNA/RNA helicase
MLLLPDFDSLSDEQDEVLDLPLDSSTIVTGPPGTGKTVMAIYRARMLHRAKRSTLLLMYGRLLSTYTQAAVEQLEVEGVVSTYHSWFTRFFREAYGRYPPRADRWDFDWSACKEVIFNSPPPDAEKRHILVDEGQDMPVDFYLLLCLISRSLTIFADENQRITDHQSTLDEIRAATGIKETMSLTRNHRNTRPIAQFAASFYTGLPSGIPELPSKRHRGSPPALLHHPRLYEAVQYVTDYERARTDMVIGVCLPYAQQIRSFYNRLSGKTHNPVQVYLNSEVGKNLPAIDFAQPGIKLVTWASSKGLQFDAVFLPELQTVRGDPCSDDVRMKLYVLSSRARRALFLMYSGSGEPEIVRTFPSQLLEDRR